MNQGDVRQVYSPGCALMIYKPALGEKILAFLNEGPVAIPGHSICCRHNPGLAKGIQIINTCAGCDRRFRELYEGISTISLWEVLADSETFPFPDYGGAKMSIHDPCPIRTEERVHIAVRKLLQKMNIALAEPKAARTSSNCCGDSFYGSLPVERVREKMKRRAGEMPCEDVVVYCVSCIKSMHIGGKKPHHVVDLLFGEDTEAGITDPDAWHSAVRQYIDSP
jgi:Fe-S oxidoreductase